MNPSLAVNASKTVTVVGAGPVGLSIARRLLDCGHNVHVVSKIIPRTLDEARAITGGNAAGYGAPFATKDAEMLACVEGSLPDWKALAADPKCAHVAPIVARTITTDEELKAFFEKNPEFLRGPSELDIPDCYELNAFSFNPRALLLDWVTELEELGATLRPEEVSVDQWNALIQGDNPFGTDVAVVCCGTGHNQFQPNTIVPVRGVLAHYRDVAIDLSSVPVSALYEDDLTKLVYLIPRPGRAGTWDLILGGTFDKGESTCSEEYKAEVVRDRIVRARQLFARVTPGLMSILDQNPDEISVGFRPLSENGGLITEHLRAGKSDVVIANGGSGQGWVAAQERARRVAKFIEANIGRGSV